MKGMGSLKKRVLELLDKDIEFRYAVAGYLGISEILKRLDVIAEEQARLREDFNREIARIWGEISKIWKEIKEMKVEQMRMRENFEKSFSKLDERLERVEKTLDKITLDIEEEARSIIRHRLREMGYEIEIGPLVLPRLEVNIYGASDILCVIGEATVRASANVIDRINHNLKLLERLYPDKIRPKVLKVVYTCLAMPELIESAEREGVWVLKATEDIVKPAELS